MATIESVGKKCCGCRTCEKICPKKAIGMIYDKEGFLIPSINHELCINCSLCEKKCPTRNELINDFEQKYFGFVNSNPEDLINSASGGFGIFASKIILENGGYVCGCVYDENNKPIHIVSNKFEDIMRMQSSKYVQSDTMNCFLEVKNLLVKGNKVLFTGTPCQVHGLKTYLGKDYENLLTIDIVCHGTPSPKLFEAYIHYLERKEKSSIKNYNFRYKGKKGWGRRYFYYYYCVETKKERTGDLGLDKYGEDFLKGSNFRESCYDCNYSYYNKRPADITMADFWGAYKKLPEKVNKKGLSSILINTKKGMDFINENKNSATIFECELGDVLPNQRNLNAPTERNKLRDHYYDGFDDTFFDRKRKPSRIMRKIKSVTPKKIKSLIKKIIRKS